jgi:anaerobic magnesium-protoporphyrin IX monomethyl ester cyclase
MKIIFLNPPYLKMFSRPQRSPAVTKSGTLYFPMWLSYAAGFAEKGGHTIDLIDAPAAGLALDAVLERVRGFAPGLIVVETSTPSIYNDVDVCGRLKQVLPGAFTILVGTHVSALPEESLGLSPAVDAVAVGEYDATIAELAAALDAGRDIATVAGLCRRGAAGPVRTAARPPIEDLDAFPFVSGIYRRFLRIGDYFNPNALYPMVTITTSRGCPFQCTFCVYPQTMMGHKLRLRSVANVLDEIEYIVREFPEAAAIFFEDDTFAAVKKRCIEIAEGIVARGLTVSWTANARADLDYETMRVMRRSGCRCLCVGFESGSQRLLDTIKKRISVDKMAQFMADARRAGILIHGCFIVGHPGETRETMEQTLALAQRLSPDTVQFYPIMVYPGTEAYDWYRERGLIATNDFSQWLTPSGLHNTVVRSEDVSAEELVRFCDRARREFYLRPGYLLYKLKQTLTKPSEMRRNLKSARTFLRHLVRGSDVPDKHC